MVQVKNGDLEKALAQYKNESSMVLKTYHNKLNFTPAGRRHKKPMKAKSAKRPGGRQHRYGGDGNVKRKT